MWKFEVENIGKVSHAEISMAPLVLLVGRNNTGKSYIATLLWALTNAQPLIWREEATIVNLNGTKRLWHRWKRTRLLKLMSPTNMPMT